jgi:hypothetical protein
VVKNASLTFFGSDFLVKRQPPPVVLVYIRGSPIAGLILSSSALNCSVLPGMGKDNIIRVFFEGRVPALYPSLSTPTAGKASPTSLYLSYAAPVVLRTEPVVLPPAGGHIVVLGNNFGPPVSKLTLGTQLSVTYKGIMCPNVQLLSSGQGLSCDILPTSSGQKGLLLVSVGGQTSNALLVTQAGPASCPRGSAFYATSLECTVCPNRTFELNGVCKPCLAGQNNSKTGQTVCEVCPAGYFSTAGSLFCSKCDAGKYSSAGTLL